MPEQARRRFIERMGEELTGAGLPRMAARMFSAIVASEAGTLTAADLCAQLQASPAAISGAARYLEQVDMVRRSRPLGARRDEFTTVDDIWYEALLSRGNVLERWQSVMHRGAVELGPQTDAGARLDRMADFFTFMQVELTALMERWHAHEAAQDDTRRS
ncbi:MarR family transcriptional regulator [Leekyejoonella antrihumi]|uniref:MarR family transcriptional regulator n=2 Tax=Leekyejoonella antrihumi TaxID=1660198 RepID=A0A563E3R1_9MICO|nr:MarR family transcriptional regulator [Leekyejoonella antrihumi]